MPTKLSIIVLLGLMAAGVLQIFGLHRANTALRLQVNERRVEHENRNARSKTPAQLHHAAAKDEEPANDAKASAGRLAQLRAEIAVLEQRAVAQADANLETTDAPSTNRDPEKGMTKLENLQNVGQGTPGAALQTLFWAAIKGDEQAMARTIGWDEVVRPKVQALIDRLPLEIRVRYPTPEALAALYISKFALDVSAIHIADTASKDGSTATLTVKGLTGADVLLPMHLRANGWQLVAGEDMLSGLNDELAGKKGK